MSLLYLFLDCYTMCDTFYHRIESYLPRVKFEVKGWTLVETFVFLSALFFNYCTKVIPIRCRIFSCIISKRNHETLMEKSNSFSFCSLLWSMSLTDSLFGFFLPSEKGSFFLSGYDVNLLCSCMKNKNSRSEKMTLREIFCSAK